MQIIWHARKVGMNLTFFHDGWLSWSLFEKKDVLLLAGVFEKFIDTCLKVARSLPLFYFSWIELGCDVNPIQDGGGAKKANHYQFSPCNFYKRKIWPPKLSTFSFNLFVILVQNFKFVPSASPKLWSLNQDHPSKKAIFLVKSL